MDLQPRFPFLAGMASDRIAEPRLPCNGFAALRSLPGTLFLSDCYGLAVGSGIGGLPEFSVPARYCARGQLVGYRCRARFPRLDSGASNSRHLTRAALP
jgi:hypothetical protein